MCDIFFLLVLEKAAQKDRRWRNDLLFSSGKTTHRRGLPLQCALSLDLRRERERERRTHDATTRGSNARRIATMTAAEDVQTRPLTEYIFGFFSL